MRKKFFAVIMAAILLIPCAALAKKSSEIPINKQIKMAVLVTNATNFSELQTEEILRDKLIAQLKAKKIFNIVNPTYENFFAETTTLENSGAADIGDLVMFPTENIELELDTYKNLGAEYVIYCEVLGIGISTESDNDFGLGNGIGIGIGTGGSFGVGIGVSDKSALRKLYCTAVNLKIVEVQSGAVVARKNLIGHALKHRKPKKGYDNAFDEAYLKSLDDAAKIITKRVLTFAEKNLLVDKK